MENGRCYRYKKIEEKGKIMNITENFYIDLKIYYIYC
jgi:hypothetical protein